MKNIKIISICIIIAILFYSSICFSGQIFEKGDKIVLNTNKYPIYYVFINPDDEMKFVDLLLVNDSEAAAKFIISRLPDQVYKLSSKDICYVEEFKKINNDLSVIQLRIKGDYRSYYTISPNAFLKVKQTNL